MTTGTPRHVWADNPTTYVTAAKLNEIEQDVADALATATTAVTSGYTDEQARDAVGAALVAGSNVTIAVNDAANTITISASGTGGSAAVTSWAGRTGDIVPTAGDVGLGNVNNTSDAAKPVSTATALAISTITANVQTVNFTLGLADAGKVIEMNLAGANILAVPPNSSTAFPIGTVIDVCQVGAGQTTIAPGSGVVLRTTSTLTTRAQWSTVTLRKRATDEWVVAGDVS